MYKRLILNYLFDEVTYYLLWYYSCTKYAMYIFISILAVLL